MPEAISSPNVAVIVEDDPDVRSILDEVFRSAGFEVVVATTGLEGVAAVEEHQPVITTLDISLPGIDGFEAARRIRKISDTFIMMVSALGDESDVVLGLGSGADEYIVKPFRPRELRARIEALMRRPRNGRTAGVHTLPSAASAGSGTRAPDVAEQWHSHRDIRLNLSTHTVQIADREVELTRTEFELLATLLESKRRVRSKTDLALILRGEGELSFHVSEPDKRAIEVHIANLRRKIGDNPTEPHYIETVRGVGYRLTLAMEALSALNA